MADESKKEPPIPIPPMGKEKEKKEEKEEPRLKMEQEKSKTESEPKKFEQPQTSKSPSKEDKITQPVMEGKDVPSQGGETREEEKKKVHEQIVNRLKEFGNKESEIPLNDQYWGLMNKYRSL